MTGIRIDHLPPAEEASPDHEFPAMRAEQAEKLTLAQVFVLLRQLGLVHGDDLGAAAFCNIGSEPETVASGDDSRIKNAVQTSRTLNTQHSLQGGGNLAANRTLSLVGDVASPGNNKIYGTNGSGARGWKEGPPGLGESWQSVIGMRSIGTSYQNTTGKYIEVNVTVLPGSSANAQPALQVSDDNSTWISVDRGQDGTDYLHGSAHVPPGHYYRVNVGQSIVIWSEMR